MNNIKVVYKNFLSMFSSNIISQVLSFFIAIYIGNTLIPEEYGIYNFIISLSMYFWMIGDLGTSLYAVKYITNSDNKDATDKIFTIKLYISLISVILYIFTSIFINTNVIDMIAYAPVVLLSSISLDYLYMSKNDMKYIGVAQLLKNIVILCFVIIIKSNKYNLFFIILSYSLGYIIAYIYQLKKYSNMHHKIRLINVTSKDIMEIGKNSIPFAFSLFMVQINNNFDILYLNFFTDSYTVGIYSAAYKIINFLIAFLTIYTNSSYSIISNQSIEILELKKVFINIFRTGITIAIPITIGGIILAQKIILLFYNEKYINSSEAFRLLILLITIRMITSSMGSVLIMRGKEKAFAQSVFIGAMINITLNLILIGKLSYIGAAIATILAESIQGYFILKHFRSLLGDLRLFKICIKPLISAIIMGVIIWYLNVNLLLSIFIGCLLYFILLAILNIKLILKIIGDRYEKFT